MNRLYIFVFLCWVSIATALAQQVSLTALNVSYEQDFNTLASSSSSNVLPLGWLMAEAGTGTANNGLYIAGTGSGTAGDTYSFGASGAVERAFGGLRSGSLIPTVGAAFVNNTGFTITSLQIQYQGEQWRLGAANRGSDRLDFQMSVDATTLLTGTWTSVDPLDFTGPINTGATGALDGNANTTAISFEITGLNIAVGQTVFIRWTDVEVSGADDGLAVDNFSITPIGPSTEPAIAFVPAPLSFGDVNVGQQQTLSYEVVASNLADSIQITLSNAALLLSVDSMNFSTSVSLPASGGVVYVQFSPTTNGLIEDSITHTSGTLSKSLAVTGFGFEQTANIISIAEARAKTVGTKVTVAGRITVANELGNPAYVQDETGGLPVFEFSLATNVQIGDSVIVTGPIGVFNEQKQISGSGIFYTKVDGPSRIVSPKEITLPDLAANEGRLVTVTDVELVNKSFVFYPQSTERITDGSTEADLRIDGDTNIPGLLKPQGAVDITGVVGRFRTNAQLLPRFQQDIPGAIEPSAPTDSIAKNKTLDVINWNFEFFGAESEDYGEEFGPADEPLQLQNIKSVLDSLNGDIIAVEEVSDEDLFASLVSQLGRYDYLCSQRYSRSFEGPSSTFPPQKVCFIYDTTTVQVLSARPMFEGLYDSARNIDPSLLPNYPTGDPSSFYSSGRLPYLLKAKATIEGVTENISLIVIHAKSGATVSDYNRRLYDGKVLKDSLDRYFADDQLIILGDLNDDLDQSITPGLPSSYADFVSDSSYLSISKALSDAGARSTVSFGDVIDHQIITNELGDEYLEGSVQIITPFRYITNYANTTSDHLPVISRYALAAPIVSFTANSLTASEDSATVHVGLVFNKPLTENKTLNILVSGTAAYTADYNLSPAAEDGMITLELNAGQSTADFEIAIVNDLLDEVLESAVFTIQETQGIEVGTDLFTLSIEDNDIPTISFVERYAEVEEGNTHGIKLKLSSAVATDQMVKINVYNGLKVDYNVDYSTVPSVANRSIWLKVLAGSTEVSVGFNALSDKKRELLEVVTFRMASTTEGLQRSGELFSIVNIRDKRQSLQFTVFPNPTKDGVLVTSEEIEADQIVHAELRNALGEKIFSGSGSIAELNTRLSKAIHEGRKGVFTLQLAVEDEISVLRILKI
jgi:hypothetical protein